MPLSFSQLQTYRRCPRQYDFAFRKKLPRTISRGESFGSSVHNALKKWGEVEMTNDQCPLRGPMTNEGGQLSLDIDDDHRDVPMPLNIDLLLDLWHSSFVVQGYPSRAEADLARKRGEGLMRQYFAWWSAEERSVRSIENGFSFLLKADGSEVKVTGRFDRVENVEGGVRVIDYKTSAPRSQEDVDSDLQLSVYALACQEVFDCPCVELILLFLSDEHCTAVQTKRSESQLTDAMTQIRLLSERMGEGDFHPTPSRETCRGCPYKGVCNSAL